MRWHYITCEPIRALAAELLCQDEAGRLGLNVRVLAHDESGVTLDAPGWFSPRKIHWRDGYRWWRYVPRADALARCYGISCRCRGAADGPAAPPHGEP
jgi:hypothetical protein